MTIDRKKYMKYYRHLKIMWAFFQIKQILILCKKLYWLKIGWLGGFLVTYGSRLFYLFYIIFVGDDFMQLLKECIEQVALGVLVICHMISMFHKKLKQTTKVVLFLYNCYTYEWNLNLCCRNNGDEQHVYIFHYFWCQQPQIELARQWCSHR